MGLERIGYFFFFYKKMEVFFLLFLNIIYGLNFIYREYIKYVVKYFKKIIKLKLN